jgi:hypothetical protein
MPFFCARKFRMQQLLLIILHRPDILPDPLKQQKRCPEGAALLIYKIKLF